MLYLVSPIDLGSRRLLHCSMSDGSDSDHVIKIVPMAVAIRRRTRTDGTIVDL